MDQRRELKRKLVACYQLVKDGKQIDGVIHEEAIVQFDSLQEQLASLEPYVDLAVIAHRRKEISRNPSLYDIFNTFWMLVAEHVDNDVLSKEGYLKFYRNVHCALFGPSPTTVDYDRRMIEIDWESDKICFGPMNRPAFFDSLYEFIEVWSGLINESYYAAFSWALLDAVGETKKIPPRLRPYSEIVCITKKPNISELLSKCYILVLCILTLIH